MTPVVQIRPAPPYFNVQRTDVVIFYENRYYGTRYNYYLANTPQNIMNEAYAFLERRTRNTIDTV